MSFDVQTDQWYACFVQLWIILLQQISQRILLKWNGFCYGFNYAHPKCNRGEKKNRLPFIGGGGEALPLATVGEQQKYAPLLRRSRTVYFFPRSWTGIHILLAVRVAARWKFACTLPLLFVAQTDGDEEVNPANKSLLCSIHMHLLIHTPNSVSPSAAARLFFSRPFSHSVSCNLPHSIPN